jgi:Protein of unknown function (DUF2631)
VACDDVAVAVTDHRPADQPSTHGVHSSQGAHSNGVDPNEEPSAEWGWHGSFPVAGPIAGWVTVVAMFAMLIGNHRGYVENVYLIIIGTVLAAMLIGSHLKARRARRR